MLLKSVVVRHYRSLADIRLDDLGPLTLLVGPNAVGKSNIIDALRFLRDLVTEGLDHAVSKRGGIGVIRQHDPSRPYQISIWIRYVLPSEDGISRDGEYEIAISSLTAGNFRIERESGRWTEKGYFDEDSEAWVDTGWKEHTFVRNADGELMVDGSVDKKFVIPRDEAVLTSRHYFIGHVLGLPVARLLSSFRFSALYPNTLREPSRPETDRFLKESGENWASILKSLRKTNRGKAALERVLEMMRIVMPSLEDVTVKTVGGYLVPQFRVKDSKNASAHDFDPVQLSDGTLRIFGLLLALYQLPPPWLMALEEPEQTIHPAILPTLAEAFREVSERTQLLITTHSPHLVDMFEPSEIRVVTMKHGKTLVSPIKASQVESVKENLISLQQLMAAEGLQPEEA